MGVGVRGVRLRGESERTHSYLNLRLVDSEGAEGILPIVVLDRFQ